MGIRLAQRSIDRITHKIRRLTRRNLGRSLEQIRDRLNPVIIGWTNYFALADAKGHIQRLDEHLRRRLRQIRVETVENANKTPSKSQGTGCLGILGHPGRGNEQRLLATICFTTASQGAE